MIWYWLYILHVISMSYILHFFQEKNPTIVFFLIFHVKSESTSAEYVAKGLF